MANRITLENNCWASVPKVTPENWRTGGKELLKKDWCIYYRFHDPNYKLKYPKGKLVQITKMNREKLLTPRRDATRELLEIVKDDLINFNFNPHTKILEVKTNKSYQIHPESTFLEALESAKDISKVSADQKTVIKSVLKYVRISAKKITIDIIPVKQIERRHIKLLLNRLAVDKPVWTNNVHNVYKRILSALFGVLVELEVIEDNPCRGIKKLPHAVKRTEILTTDDRIKIKWHLLRNKKVGFWISLNMYFGSGARESELLRLKVKDCNLAEQTFIRTIIKGGKHFDKIGTIPQGQLKYWRSQIQGAKLDNYVFSVGLKPGEKQVRRDVLGRYWNRWVKSLGITADFRALAHLFLDELNESGLASKHRGHTSDKITKKHYLVGEEKRVHEKLKGISNEF